MASYLSIWISLTVLIFEINNNTTVLSLPHRGNVHRSSSDDSECDAGFICIPARYCPQYNTGNSESDSAIFPCRASSEVMVCCRREASRRTTTPASTRRTTTRRRTTTTTTTTTTTPQTTITRDSDMADMWSSVSPELQEKAKLLPVTCGSVQVGDRILNGEIAELGQFPWMVLIGYEINGMKQFWCGGSLISNRYILTAAHCSQITTFKPTLARLGEWNVSSTTDCQSNGIGRRPTCSDDIIDAPIEEVITHERFGDKDLPSLQNDIALIRLAIEVKFTDYIAPICISPKLRSITSDTYTVSGWGVSKPGSSQPNPLLQYVEVYLFDTSECNSIAPTEVKPLVSGQFCAGGADGKDACKGDSGGPLTYDINNRYYQKGIVSLATSEICGTEGRPSIYTEVSVYMDWILTKLRP